MKGFFSELMPLNNAIELLDNNQTVTNIESIDIEEAHNRVLAEDIYSFHNSPPFDKSAMDGYAVIAEDTFGASNNNHISLKIIDFIGAGDFSEKTIKNGEAIRIATGAPIPNGANAVLMEEFTSNNGDILEVHSQVSPKDNVSFVGEDLTKGDKVLNSNTLIRSQEVGLIASSGFKTIKVYKKPRVKLIITGNELVEPSKKLDKAKIINSNKYTISSLIKGVGAIVELDYAKDDFDEVKSIILESSKNFDVVITTGGTAISKGDVVVDAVEDLGEILFHGVSIRPGKPIGCGIVNDTVVFTLSGQPVAAMTQFDIFARKFLINMQGLNYEPKIVERESIMKIPSNLGRTDFIRTYADETHARHILNRGSGIIRSMVEANSYIIIDENNEGIEKGDFVNLIFFDSMILNKY
jgi:molybdopterin molybdotransferase